MLCLFLEEGRDNQDYNNYLPISLILTLTKLIEKLVHKRLHNGLEKHSLLFEKHYDLCTKMSTNPVLIDRANKGRQKQFCL